MRAAEQQVIVGDLRDVSRHVVPFGGWFQGAMLNVHDDDAVDDVVIGYRIGPIGEWRGTHRHSSFPCVVSDAPSDADGVQWKARAARACHTARTTAPRHFQRNAAPTADACMRRHRKALNHHAHSLRWLTTLELSGARCCFFSRLLWGTDGKHGVVGQAGALFKRGGESARSANEVRLLVQ
jgi:hypothetical protein